jgi:hypothetical protein
MSRDEIIKRLADYAREDVGSQRARLVAEWRRQYPAAANEASSASKPLALIMKREPGEHGSLPDEEYCNDTYYVTLRRHDTDPVFGTRAGMIQLGIASLDGMARHDWRDFQAIKNQLAGPETEAFELYPAESRLLDPSNYYTLWCFPGLRRLKIGQEKREVLDADHALPSAIR